MKHPYIGKELEDTLKVCHKFNSLPHSPDFNDREKERFRKHCGKRRKCQ